MPSKSRHEWVLQAAHFKQEGAEYMCQHGSSDKPCSFHGPRHPSNMRVHLRTQHGIETPRRNEDQRKLNFNIMPAFTLNERWACVWATCGWSFNSCGNVPFKDELMPSLPHRQTLATATESASSKAKRAVLQRMKNITLCYDSGTVHQRYLFVVASTPEGSAIVAAVGDARFADEKMTSENIEAVLAEVRSEVESCGGYVVATVADNASNMQGAQLEGAAKIRCAAHVLQLALKATPEKNATIARAIELTKDDPTLPRVPETRWGYNLRRIEAAIKQFDNEEGKLEDRHSLELAAQLLKPFSVATDMVQSNTATLFTSLVAWEQLLATVDESLRQLVVDRFKYLLTPAYLVVAYFSPTTDCTKHGSVLTELVDEALANPRLIEDHLSYCKVVRRKREGAISFEDYTKHVNDRIRPRWPRLATHIEAILNSTPTEASVERGFSTLKLVANDWRNRLRESTVESIMVLRSCYAFLENEQRKCAPSETPIKKNRTEGIQTPSPSPAKPPTFDVETDEEISSEDEPFEESQVEQGPMLNQIFQHVVDVLVAEKQNVRHEVQVARAGGTRAPTRRAADTCALCGKQCRDHDLQAYVSCKCGKRVSVSHAELMFPLHMVQNAEQLKATHTRLDLDFTCDECAARS